MKLYDDGYAECSCFWGTEPANLVKEAVNFLADPDSNVVLKAIDLGCGEGKNSNYLSKNGIAVIGIDESELAIQHANTLWPNCAALFLISDMQQIEASGESYDIVVSTGSIHCLENQTQVLAMLNKLKEIVKRDGVIVFSSFNDRHQDYAGHPNSFNPILLSHDYFVDAFAGFQLIHCSDKDLIDTHPHTKIEHVHSITRILAKKS